MTARERLVEILNMVDDMRTDAFQHGAGNSPTFSWTTTNLDISLEALIAEARAETEREIVQLVTDRLKNWKFADVNQELKSLRNHITSGRYRKGDE